MTNLMIRLGTAVAATAVAGAALAAPAVAAPAVPGVPAPHDAASMKMADWYGTAFAVTLLSPDNGWYTLQHDGGSRPVVLEQRNVKYRKRAKDPAATPWRRLAIAHRGSPLLWGQWSRLPGFTGKQFRLCRLAVDGKQCTSYSGILTA
ncbi:MAG: hypothetical protein QM728_14560 [Gordonia sp. (in: high G+C Gram-positive bacteria)]|uniref:hypothetical protein n=1 Tax=Gordonia sp. (in: high G+C Gram-positive bacteria) TaxID=84139 RepID=UPI0039E283F7